MQDQQYIDLLENAVRSAANLLEARKNPQAFVREPIFPAIRDLSIALNNMKQRSWAKLLIELYAGEMEAELTHATNQYPMFADEMSRELKLLRSP